MDTSNRENDRVECISEAHLQYMRDYISRENERSKQAAERFLKVKGAIVSEPSHWQSIAELATTMHHLQRSFHIRILPAQDRYGCDHRSNH
jgi:hypothetical protein